MGSASADTNRVMKQYVATKKGGPFQLVNGIYPTPGPNEICIRNRAVALNPLDWKNLYHGQMVQSWPEVFGIDTAGVVEVVGEKVTAFKAGDAVLSSAGLGGRRGAFQDITTVPEHFASRKPVSWTFAQACTVPICYLAAAAAITRGLSTPLPHLTPPTTLRDECERASPASGSEYQQNLRKKSLTFNSSQQLDVNLNLLATPPRISSVLILGGSSGVGASAIQLLRLALGNSATILSTNSPAHNKRLVSLGVTACFDRYLPAGKLVEAIQKASPGGEGVDAILDAVAVMAASTDGAYKTTTDMHDKNKDNEKEKEKESPHALFEVLKNDGRKLYTHVFTGREVQGIPEGVRCTKVFAHMMLRDLQGRDFQRDMESGNGVGGGREGGEGGITSGGYKGIHVVEGMDAMANLADLAEEGKFKLPLEVEVVGKGLEDVSGGLDRLKKGVSGVKLVVAL